jgi:hypothetical protein
MQPCGTVRLRDLAGGWCRGDQGRRAHTEDAGEQDFALAEAVFDASGRQIAAVLAGSRTLPRRMR